MLASQSSAHRTARCQLCGTAAVCVADLISRSAATAGHWLVQAARASNWTRHRKTHKKSLHRVVDLPTVVREVCIRIRRKRYWRMTRGKKGHIKGLGALEADVMDVLWEHPEPQSVREILDRISAADQAWAYTTILTVMTHLFEKGWVDRDKQGLRFLYWPTRSRAEATSQALRAILDASTDSAAVLLHLAKHVSASESAALRRGLAGGDSA